MKGLLFLILSFPLFCSGQDTCALYQQNDSVWLYNCRSSYGMFTISSNGYLDIEIGANEEWKDRRVYFHEIMAILQKKEINNFTNSKKEKR